MGLFCKLYVRGLENWYCRWHDVWQPLEWMCAAGSTIFLFQASGALVGVKVGTCSNVSTSGCSCCLWLCFQKPIGTSNSPPNDHLVAICLVPAVGNRSPSPVKWQSFSRMGRTALLEVAGGRKPPSWRQAASLLASLHPLSNSACLQIRWMYVYPKSLAPDLI